MKVIYYSKDFLADCDFPLVKALQNKGIDVYYFIPLNRNFRKSVLFNFKEPFKKAKLIKASNIKEMMTFRECIDLDRLYFISGYSGRIWWPFSWILWLRTMRLFKEINPDVIHLAYHLTSPFEKLIYRLPFKGKKIVTVHDPFIHSNKPNAKKIEQDRLKLFKWADRFILLNDIQSSEFARHYEIPKSNINISHLGIYDTITKITPKPTEIKDKYILFFGLMAHYKGLDILLDAMKQVHKNAPDLKLVIAGGGNLDFDISKYNNSEYIEWRHRYIPIDELAGLLQNAEFSVCPYRDATQSGVVQTSLSMRCPVLGTNVGALSTAIKDGITGRIIHPCDVDALTDAILDWYNNPSYLEEIRENIELVWKPSMSWDKIADSYIEIYKD